MNRIIYFFACIALGLWVISCNQSAEPEPPEEEGVEVCEDVYYRCNTGGTDLWPSLRTDADIQNRLVGKWQQIAWSGWGDEEMFYEESENTVEFTQDLEQISTEPSVTCILSYHIDSDYLYTFKIFDSQPVRNGDVFFYDYRFSDDGEELTLKLLAGSMLAIYHPIHFVYRRIH
ncbi:MAG: hypothetical protein LBJ01_00920 [Tannerella sp.]|jgi:hypothetical protein|nr:hypothetical protein [Tannerella sp.]